MGDIMYRQQSQKRRLRPENSVARHIDDKALVDFFYKIWQLCQKAELINPQSFRNQVLREFFAARVAPRFPRLFTSSEYRQLQPLWEKKLWRLQRENEYLRLPGRFADLVYDVDRLLYHYDVF